MQSPASPTLIGKRYLLHDLLGRGGMGAVYRATDRLNGQTVALKRVIPPAEQSSLLSTHEGIDLRLALAREFQMLSSLRHPNIIGVLDYGFDETRQPYFTMEVLENAQDLVQTHGGQSPESQVGLLIQTLQALEYLHRRSILHRDLKPRNVLVVEGQVRVLDFGLSEIRRHTPTIGGSTAGTVRYIAPEVLNGQPPSDAADLYAVGVMVYEIFAGEYPFMADTFDGLFSKILAAAPDMQRLKVDAALQLVIQRLMAKDPLDRYPDARAAILALSEANHQLPPKESAAIRESFLQAAQVVGRTHEIWQLSETLDDARAGEGSGWFVGGESGVGKSRLINEVRTLALVQGAQVVRGQAISEGSVPYQVWREALRWLSLSIDLDDQEAGVLQPLVPDISILLGREIPPVPVLDPQPTQDRLLNVIEEMFRRQQQPLVLILEDLHWAGSENLAILNRLVRIAGELSLLLIGSYRDDERPDLPAILPDMSLLKLNRLSQEGIAELSQSMLGNIGRKTELITLLQRETEGNVFFLVEVMRALAEEAGELSNIAMTKLPEQISAGGVKQIVQRRLSRVAAEDRPLLQAAAIAGRLLDLNVLRKLGGSVDFATWLITGNEMAILEVQEGQWRFAHDKLREGLVESLTDFERRSLHQQVALATEAAYPDSPQHAAALAHHWAMAGDRTKELHYSDLAGEQTLQSGAYEEAIRWFGQGIQAAAQLGITDKLRLAHWERQLGEAYYGLGNLSACQQHLNRTLELIDRPMPSRRGQWVANLLGQVFVQVGHRLLPIRFTRNARAKAGIVEAARAYDRLARIYYIGSEKLPIVYSAVRRLNLSEAAAPSTESGLAYATICLVVGAIPLHSLARTYSKQARQTAEHLTDPSSQASIWQLTSMYDIGVGKLATAQPWLERAVEKAEGLGNWRLLGENLSMLGLAHYFQGNFAKCMETYLKLYDVGKRSGDRQQQSWSESMYGLNVVRLGRTQEAMPYLESSRDWFLKDMDRNSLLNIHARLALAHLQLGDLKKAEESAAQAVAISSTYSPVGFTVLEGYAGGPETYLQLWEAASGRSGKERDALENQTRLGIKALHSYARVFPLGLTRAHRFEGTAHWLSGDKQKADKSWHKALSYAKQFGMRFDEALAHYELGRHLELSNPLRREHLEQARGLFDDLKAIYNVTNVELALNSE